MFVKYFIVSRIMLVCRSRSLCSKPDVENRCRRCCTIYIYTVVKSSTHRMLILLLCRFTGLQVWYSLLKLL